MTAPKKDAVAVTIVEYPYFCFKCPSSLLTEVVKRM